VDEADTGQLLFGGGISSSTGLFGRIVFIQRNFDITDVPTSIDAILDGHFFVGAGQTLIIQAEPGQRRSRYSLTFVEPSLLPEVLPLPIQLRTTFSYYDSVLARSYEEERVEGQVGFGYRITRDSLFEFAYRVTHTNIFGVDRFAPADVVEVAGVNLVSAGSLSYNINRNKQDQSLLYYGGWGAGAEVEAAGGPFGGDHDFVRVEASANAQETLFTWPRDSKHVISGRLSGGTCSRPDTHTHWPAVRPSMRPFTARVGYALIHASSGAPSPPAARAAPSSSFCVRANPASVWATTCIGRPRFNRRTGHGDSTSDTAPSGATNVSQRWT
jgi:outer membrane protein assembly factor BamA